MTVGTQGVDAPKGDPVLSDAEEMARQLSYGFKAHDKGMKQAAIDAFAAVDVRQFAHLDEGLARQAADAFVEALWAKDDLELTYMRGGGLDQEGLRRADYGPVRQKLRQRASLVGADPEYAVQKALAWKRHKTGGDYWTPFQRSQVYELRAALQDDSYPSKPRAGLAGPGPDAMRYALAFELHDMHTETHWEQGVQVMIPYFQRILEEHDDESA